MNQYNYLKSYMEIFDEDIGIQLEDELEIDKPIFLQKYHGSVISSLYKSSIQRLRFVSQFCGCDYTKLYNTKFFYSRFYHSLVVANMTWHFTHNKKETIAAFFHDAGTPCFAHVIDYMMKDYLLQESSEKNVVDVIKTDKEALNYLKENNIDLDEFKELLKNPILENKTPNLCTDRLDGVLGTCYIWLNTHTLEEIEEVYKDLCVLTNESGQRELGFKSIKMAEKFSEMVYIYATELQTNRDKFVMQYISDVIKESIDRNLLSIDDLYKIKESELIKIFKNNFESWNKFEEAKNVTCSNHKPNCYYISVGAKKRNVIPLVSVNGQVKRLNEVSKRANNLYQQINDFTDREYGYIKKIKKV